MRRLAGRNPVWPAGSEALWRHSPCPDAAPSLPQTKVQKPGFVMIQSRPWKIAVLLGLVALTASCGRGNRAPGQPLIPGDADAVLERSLQARGTDAAGDGTSIFDLFRPRNTDVSVAVNKYLWNASLEVLNFLPVQSVDPFTGVIVTGYGVPPGGGRAYRATVLVKDPALEARSLVVSLQSQGGGAVSPGTLRAVEDAILSRARQLRISDKRL